MSPMNENELENRIIELEIRLALQDELLGVEINRVVYTTVWEK